MREILAFLTLVFLAACAGTPAPIPPPVYYPPPDYGPPGDPRNPAQGPFQPNAFLYVCPGRAQNVPAYDRNGAIFDHRPVIDAFGIVMVSVPANEVCLSSGYGQRSERLHKGADYAPRPRGEPRTIYTAAPGIVREARSASGFGNYVLIDHGDGVFTRYAHMAAFEPWVVPGAEIGFGHALGLMGRSGNASAVHLHFEVLTGDPTGPRGSFGLTPHDPLAFPAWAGLDAAIIN